MERYPDYTRTRLHRLLDRLRANIYSESHPLTSLVVSEPVGRISYDEAQRLETFHDAKLGDQFGPLWTTYWFRAKATVPNEWKGKRVDLLWESHSEATLWVGGRSVQGLNHNPRQWDGVTRPDAVLTDSALGGDVFDFQIEMACNRLFGAEEDNTYGTYTHISPYVLDRAEIAVFDQEAWDLYQDFVFLQHLEADGHAGKPHPLELAWSGRLLSELNRFANTVVPEDRSTWAPAREILKGLFEVHNSNYCHEQWAVGHAHIDTAWLWPLAETFRKCDRTFSSQVTYMDVYPDYNFAVSQAYQYEIIKKRNPDLYERIKAKVASGQWLPVGGTWVEPDCNLPSGESLIRQFLFGQRLFEKEFGKRCSEFWNPDVFGYNGQLPQILNICGVKRFLTQKLSWNRFNKPQHHTFMWQGIDGSEVLTHFPPMDTYNSDASVRELRYNEQNFKDHDRSNLSLILFGYGDGGGGPTKRMIESLRRAKDIAGVPKTKIGTVEGFFDKLEENYQDRTTMVGELYLEYHRGTYTTQAATKKGNRKSEFNLHNAEFLSAVALLTKGREVASEKLNELWKLVLLDQFHDILPGSSITLVYEDTARDYAKVEKETQEEITASLTALSTPGTSSPINTTSFARAEVVTTPSGDLAYVTAPSYGAGQIAVASDKVLLTETAEGYVLENSALKAVIAKTGLVTSLIEKSSGRESLAGPANAFKLYDDHPNDNDAWDNDPFHLETEYDASPAKSSAVVTNNDLRVEVAFEYDLGKASSIKQVVRLDAGAVRLEFHTQVEWHEDHTMLKATFPVNVLSQFATYEMQFGIAERPTHFNTTFDLARYEVPGHKWSDLSEYGFGVALLSEAKYGYSTFGNVMRLSLLRSPKAPDPVADRGHHEFSYALLPHVGGWREAGVVAEGFRFNVPLLWAPGTISEGSLLSVDDANLVIDTVKKAEDSDALIVRLYEAHGARGNANLKVALPFKTATLTNALEDEIESVPVDGDTIPISYSPYQVITLKLS